MDDNTVNSDTTEKLPASASEQDEETALEKQAETPLTKRMRLWQILGGWLFGFAIWFCLALSAYFPDNVLMTWLFLGIFVIAMIVRRQVELRTGISMRLYMKHLLISLVVFLGVFIILGPVTHLLDVEGL